MSDVYDPTRLGQANNTGDTDALFLKVFSNEILATFEKTQIMKPLHTIRTISSGKSATFATIGTATAKYHTPGENIMTKSHDHDADGSTAEVSKYTTNFNMNEQVVNIDKMLVSSTFVPNIDELKNHFDVRGQFSKELGTALAQRFDKAVLKTLAAGATDSSAQPSGQPAGINFDGATSTGAELVSTIAKIAQLLDENDVPDDGTRFAILKPAEYYKLIGEDNIAIQRDYGGSGGVAAGNIPQIAGINIYKSNNLKSVAATLANQTDSDDSLSNNDVFGGSGAGYNPTDLSSTVILGGHPSAVGTVKLLDLATETDYSVAHQGTLMVAKYAMGHAVLRAGACVNVT